MVVNLTSMAQTCQCQTRQKKLTFIFKTGSADIRYRLSLRLILKTCLFLYPSVKLANLSIVLGHDGYPMIIENQFGCLFNKPHLKLQEYVLEIKNIHLSKLY